MVEAVQGGEGFVIVVAGTPGVGKSTFSHALAELMGCRVIEPSRIAVERSLGSPDPEREGTLIIDEEALLRAVKGEIRGRCSIIATHYPGVFLNDDDLYQATPLVALLRLNPLLLVSRLEGRGWGRRKVLENVMAEALGSVAQELKEFEDMVIEVDTSGVDLNGSLARFFEKVEAWDVGIRVDWLTLDEVVQAVVRWGAELDLYEDRPGY
ncbi:MAG: AAA family ATPase [Acidilobus sp.]